MGIRLLNNGFSFKVFDFAIKGQNHRDPFIIRPIYSSLVCSACDFHLSEVLMWPLQATGLSASVHPSSPFQGHMQGEGALSYLLSSPLAFAILALPAIRREWLRKKHDSREASNPTPTQIQLNDFEGPFFLAEGG